MLAAVGAGAAAGVGAVMPGGVGAVRAAAASDCSFASASACVEPAGMQSAADMQSIAVSMQACTQCQSMQPV